MVYVHVKSRIGTGTRKVCWYLLCDKSIHTGGIGVGGGTTSAVAQFATHQEAENWIRAQGREPYYEFSC